MVDIHRSYFENPHPLCGRHVVHDPRSRDYAWKAPRAVLGSTPRSVRHRSHLGILDQGDLGSCTGNASTKAITYGHFWRLSQQHLLKQGQPNWQGVDERYAIGVYSDATRLDDVRGTFPPDDTGSAGIYVAKVLQGRGLIGTYRHTFSFEDFLAAVAHQAVIIGIPWYEGMFNPDEEGYIRPTGQVAGGHEVCIDEINFEERYVEFPNSWGLGWGLKGRAKVAWDDMADLLDQDGDCTVFSPVSA
jgi:hypothetical protein